MCYCNCMAVNSYKVFVHIIYNINFNIINIKILPLKIQGDSVNFWEYIIELREEILQLIFCFIAQNMSYYNFTCAFEKKFPRWCAKNNLHL